MKKYIYKTYYYLNISDLQKILDGLSEAGYRLFSIDSQTKHVVFEKEEKDE